MCRDGLTASAGSLAPAVAGEEITDLQLMPDNRGLLAATGDCRILLFQAEVSRPVSPHGCVGSTTHLLRASQMQPFRQRCHALSLLWTLRQHHTSAACFTDAAVPVARALWSLRTSCWSRAVTSEIKG